MYTPFRRVCCRRTALRVFNAFAGYHVDCILRAYLKNKTTRKMLARVYPINTILFIFAFGARDEEHKKKTPNPTALKRAWPYCYVYCKYLLTFLSSHCRSTITNAETNFRKVEPIEHRFRFNQQQNFIQIYLY